jgi:hypothetical protein
MNPYDLFRHRNQTTRQAKSDWSGNWSVLGKNPKKTRYYLGFAIEDRCLDTVGVSGSKPHAPTNPLNNLRRTTRSVAPKRSNWHKLINHRLSFSFGTSITSLPFSKRKGLESVIESFD